MDKLVCNKNLIHKDFADKDLCTDAFDDMISYCVLSKLYYQEDSMELVGNT
jgi:hypothetical protein